MRNFDPYLLLMLTLFLLHPVQGIAQQVHTYVDVDSVQVGDIFQYIVVIEGDFDSVSYPDEYEFEQQLEVISHERHQVSSRKDSLVFELQFFGTEDITIGRREIPARISGADTTLATTRVPLFFKSSLAEGDEEFRPFKPIFDFARNYWLAVILILVLAIAGYLFYRWYNSREPAPEPAPAEPPKPFTDPLEHLKKQLSELPASGLLKKEGDFDAYYVALGDAIRLYLKRVYFIPALEMTTREITAALQKKMAPDDIISITKRVLSEADMVKFANFRPEVEQAESVFQTAQKFVEVVSITDSERIDHLKLKYEREHGLTSHNRHSRPGGFQT